MQRHLVYKIIGILRVGLCLPFFYWGGGLGNDCRELCGLGVIRSGFALKAIDVANSRKAVWRRFAGRTGRRLSGRGLFVFI